LRLIFSFKRRKTLKMVGGRHSLKAPDGVTAECEEAW